MANFQTVSRFCLFCYKTVVPSTKNPNSSFNINMFDKLLNRFSNQQKVNPLIDLLNTRELLECCDKCENIVNEFCSSFTQLKVLEFKLDYMLAKLVETIDYANKVPARWIHVNKVLEETLQNDMDKKAENQIRVRKFRQNIIKVGKYHIFLIN